MLSTSIWLIVAAALAAIYAVYILWAKFAKIIGPPPIKLSETGEFWLFFAAIATFTIHIIVVERNAGPSTKSPE